MAETKKWRTAILEDLKLYVFYVIFLTIFFSLFSVYRRLILAEAAVDYVHTGYSFVEALILGKIILIGQKLKLGEGYYGNKPLIYPTLYKTFIFSLFVLAFSFIEEFVVGFFKSKSMHEVYIELLNKDMKIILAKILIMVFVFVIFFAFLEISSYLGKGKFEELFFKKKI